MKKRKKTHKLKNIIFVITSAVFLFCAVFCVGYYGASYFGAQDNVVSPQENSIQASGGVSHADGNWCYVKNGMRIAPGLLVPSSKVMCKYGVDSSTMKKDDCFPIVTTEGYRVMCDSKLMP